MPIPTSLRTHSTQTEKASPPHQRFSSPLSNTQSQTYLVTLIFAAARLHRPSPPPRFTICPSQLSIFFLLRNRLNFSRRLHFSKKPSQISVSISVLNLCLSWRSLYLVDLSLSFSAPFRLIDWRFCSLTFPILTRAEPG